MLLRMMVRVSEIKEDAVMLTSTVLLGKYPQALSPMLQLENTSHSNFGGKIQKDSRSEGKGILQLNGEMILANFSNHIVHYLQPYIGDASG